MPRAVSRKKLKKLERIRLTYEPERSVRLVEEGPQQSIIAFVDTGLEQCVPNQFLRRVIISHGDER